MRIFQKRAIEGCIKSGKGLARLMSKYSLSSDQVDVCLMEKSGYTDGIIKKQKSPKKAAVTNIKKEVGAGSASVESK